MGFKPLNTNEPPEVCPRLYRHAPVIAPKISVPKRKGRRDSSPAPPFTSLGLAAAGGDRPTRKGADHSPDESAGGAVIVVVVAVIIVVMAAVGNLAADQRASNAANRDTRGRSAAAMVAVVAVIAA